MGFKWFRARMRMNKMPIYTTAVEGIYRPMSQYEFDLQNTSNSGSSLRSQSMSALNNPVIGLPNGQISRENKKLDSRTKLTRDTSKSADDLVAQQEDFYVVNSGLRIQESTESTESVYDQTTNISTKNITSKSRKAEFKRKKVRAPMPRVLEATSGNQSENGTTKFVAMEKVKTSDDNVIEI